MRLGWVGGWVVQTEQCGWGVVAAEAIAAGQFVVEYVGEGEGELPTSYVCMLKKMDIAD